ncbi:uncharacterized protein BDR25DRAFT_339195 [Lindgomyces ingoldianus]|uniref:Uncharacterized protein n=1 Tax=Lindgomyces ingoldianus TaxID=673940 RepID=A0ACB6REP1_9PLEO|nr:uncharacterized protein BDR25DRAFT_339195 [Lindgomyces ingoldianus]KAF2477218.1 hypothetical protein BDR25DRAFT_339195 [Lindgomyces ingoldianus]
MITHETMITRSFYSRFPTSFAGKDTHQDGVQPPISSSAILAEPGWEPLKEEPTVSLKDSSIRQIACLDSDPDRFGMLRRLSRCSSGTITIYEDPESNSVEDPEGTNDAPPLQSERSPLPSSSSQSRSDFDESFFWLDGSDSGSALITDDMALNQLRPVASLLLFDKFWFCPSGFEQETSGSLQNYTSCDTENTSSGSFQKSSKGKKRKEGNSSDGGDEHRPFRRKVSRFSGEIDEKLLACPFCKNDARRYRGCYKYILRDISRLKQHLARKHRIPTHCPSCSLKFESELERDQHIRARSCEILPPRNWDGIDQSQKRQLEQRVSPGKTKEENWYIIYEILFPGKPRPRSPYVDAPLSDDLLALREFAAIEGPNIVSDLTRNELPESLRPNEQEIQSFLESIFQDAVALLLERHVTTRPGQLRTSLTHQASTGSSDSGFVSSGADPSQVSGHSNDADAANELMPPLNASIFKETLNHDLSNLPICFGNPASPPWNPLFAAELVEVENDLDHLLDSLDEFGDTFQQGGHPYATE